MTHRMKLLPAPFAKMKAGQKQIELRLFDEKRRTLRPGDRIEFTQTESGEKLVRTVKALHVFPNFAALYKAILPTLCGYAPGEAADPRDMEALYPPARQEEWGVVGIELAEDTAE